MAQHDPKKPNQIPDGDLSDAVKTHEESDFQDDQEDEDGDELETPDDDTSDFE